MSPVEIPRDNGAERAVAGVVANTVHGHPCVAALVTAEDFYVPALGRIFAASALIPYLTDLDVRVAGIVELAQVDEAMLLELIDEAPVMIDASRWARRVADAARRRRAMAAAAELYNRLGEGVGLCDVRPVVEELAATVLGGTA